MFSSIKISIISINLFLVLSVSAAVMGFVVFEYENLYEEAVSKNLDGLTDNISLELIEDLVSHHDGNPKKFEVSQRLLKLQPYDDILYASVYDLAGNIIHEYLHPSQYYSDIPANELFGLEANDKFKSGTRKIGDYVYSTKSVGDDPVSVGFITVVHDFEGPLTASQYRLLSQTAPTVIVSTAVVMLLGLILINRLLMPLGKLSTFTKQIENTKNYSLRFRVTGRNEVSQLSKNVNNMLDTINQELEKNKSHTRKLEEQREEMTRIANYDALTGLPNRQFIMDTLRYKIADAERSGKDLSLLFFDLDGFKAINDSLGHDAGDHVLVQVGERVSKLMRNGDMVSRLGGDEFLVVPYDEPSEDEIKQICIRILEEVEQPIMMNGLELRVGLSIGIANAKDAKYDLTDLVSNADIAMYRSKANGRGTFTLFHRDLIQDYKRKLLITNSISRGVEENEFRLVYQAKINQFGRLIGFEALIRWVHPELGNISPGEFIPIAEQSGKVPLITQWVIKQVCIEMDAVQSLTEYDVVVSLNLSAHDIANEGLVDFVRNKLDFHKVNPAHVEFEVTETAYLDSFETSNECLKLFADLGCNIALDDFGTGYSSLSYLTQIKIDTLKIDQSFVKEIDYSSRSRLVTSTIIDLAKSLNLKICAEGIESRAQQKYLTQLGCDYYQGYLYSRPLPLRELFEKDFNFEAEFQPSAVQLSRSSALPKIDVIDANIL